MIILCCLDFRCLVAPFWAQRRVRVNFLSLRQKSHRSHFQGNLAADSSIQWKQRSKILSGLLFTVANLLNSFFTLSGCVRLEERFILILHTARRRSDHFRLTCGILSFRRPVGNRFFFAEMKRHTQKTITTKSVVRVCEWIWFLHVCSRLLRVSQIEMSWNSLSLSFKNRPPLQECFVSFLNTLVIREYLVSSNIIFTFDKCSYKNKFLLFSFMEVVFGFSL